MKKGHLKSLLKPRWLIILSALAFLAIFGIVILGSWEAYRHYWQTKNILVIVSLFLSNLVICVAAWIAFLSARRKTKILGITSFITLIILIGLFRFNNYIYSFLWGVYHEDITTIWYLDLGVNFGWVLWSYLALYFLFSFPAIIIRGIKRLNRKVKLSLLIIMLLIIGTVVSRIIIREVRAAPILKFLDSYVKAFENEDIDSYLFCFAEPREIQRIVLKDYFDNHEQISLKLVAFPLFLNPWDSIWFEDDKARVNTHFQWKSILVKGETKVPTRHYGHADFTLTKKSGLWKITKVESKWGSDWWRREEIYRLKKELTEKQDPTRIPGIYLNLGRIYRQLRMYEEAKETYQKIINEYPKSKEAVSAHAGLGRIFFFPERNYQKALKKFQTIHSQFRIGECYQKLGEFDKAIEAYQKFIEDYPEAHNVAEAYFKIGECYEEKGEHQKAIATYQTLKSKYPDSWSAQRQVDKRIKAIKFRERHPLQPNS